MSQASDYNEKFFVVGGSGPMHPPKYGPVGCEIGKTVVILQQINKIVVR